MVVRLRDSWGTKSVMYAEALREESIFLEYVPGTKLDLRLTDNDYDRQRRQIDPHRDGSDVTIDILNQGT